MVYEKIDKCDVADARFLPWCACPLSPACRSLATTTKSRAALLFSVGICVVRTLHEMMLTVGMLYVKMCCCKIVALDDEHYFY